MASCAQLQKNESQLQKNEPGLKHNESELQKNEPSFNTLRKSHFLRPFFFEAVHWFYVDFCIAFGIAFVLILCTVFV